MDIWGDGDDSRDTQCSPLARPPSVNVSDSGHNWTITNRPSSRANPTGPPGLIGNPAGTMSHGGMRLTRRPEQGAVATCFDTTGSDGASRPINVTASGELHSMPVTLPTADTDRAYPWAEVLR